MTRDIEDFGRGNIDDQSPPAFPASSESAVPMPHPTPSRQIDLVDQAEITPPHQVEALAARHAPLDAGAIDDPEPQISRLSAGPPRAPGALRPRPRLRTHASRRRHR